MIFEDENVENQVNSILGSSKEKNAFIKNALKDLSLNLQVDVDALDKSVLFALEKLLNERDHWRRESNTFSQETFRMHSVNDVLKREKEQQESIVESLRMEVQTAHSHMSAQLAEQREVKNHWLAERADLQSRLLQVQNLNAQMQGTMKKKEKEFERLQSQLAKVVKDSFRGSKSTMMVSAPQRRAGSQESNAVISALLRDAEVQALRNSLLSFQRENTTLNVSFKEIESQLLELRGTFQDSIRAIEEKYKVQIDALEKDKLHHKRFLQQSASSSSREMEKTSVTEVAPKTPSCSKYPPKTPGTLTRKYLNSTPGARPVQWLIDQANTEMKNFRVRAACTSTDELPMSTDVHSLHCQLAEAMVVIREQDRLIREALLSKIPPDHCSNVDILRWDTEEDDDGLFVAPTSGVVASFSTRNSDLLPPASPETMDLLESLGWSVPKYSTSSLTTNKNESCVEQLEFD